MTKEEMNRIKELLKSWCKERGLTLDINKNSYKHLHQEEKDEYEEAKKNNDVEGMIDAISDMCVVDINADVYDNLDWYESLMDELGYDLYLCMIETIKEIDSRSGAWSDEVKKWVKDPGAYDLAELIKKYNIPNDCPISGDMDYWYIEDGSHRKFKKWHKADYSKCKKGEKEDK